MSVVSDLAVYNFSLFSGHYFLLFLDIVCAQLPLNTSDWWQDCEKSRLPTLRLSLPRGNWHEMRWVQGMISRSSRKEDSSIPHSPNCSEKETPRKPKHRSRSASSRKNKNLTSMCNATAIVTPIKVDGLMQIKNNKRPNIINEKSDPLKQQLRHWRRIVMTGQLFFIESMRLKPSNWFRAWYRVNKTATKPANAYGYLCNLLEVFWGAVTALASVAKHTKKNHEL